MIRHVGLVTQERLIKEYMGIWKGVLFSIERMLCYIEEMLCYIEGMLCYIEGMLCYIEGALFYIEGCYVIRRITKKVYGRGLFTEVVRNLLTVQMLA